jgi:hypothetical protein
MAMACANGNGNNFISVDSSFESGLEKFFDFFSSPYLTWDIDHQDGADGWQSAKLSVYKDCLIRSNPISIPSDPREKTVTLSFYAKADKEGVPVELSFIKTNWGLRIDTSSQAISREWKRYSFTISLDPDEYWIYFHIKEPCVLWLDAVQVEKGKQATPYRNNTGTVSLDISLPADHNYVFLKGEKVPISIFSGALQKKDNSLVQAELDVRIVHCSDRIEEILNVKRKCMYQDGRLIADFSFIPEKLGCYYMTARLVSGKETITASHTFAVVAPPVEIKKGLMPFCGLVTYEPEIFPGYQRIGGGQWSEINIHWKGVEPEKGKYSLPDVSTIAQLHEKGIKFKICLLHLPSAPAWAQDSGDIADAKNKKASTSTEVGSFGVLPAESNMQDWRNFIHHIVETYKGMIDIFEIGAEDDLTFGSNAYYLQKNPSFAKKGRLIGGPDYERYVRMIRAACEEIRNTDPAIKIGIVRPSGGDCPEFSFTAPVIKECADVFDLLPLDCYSGTNYVGPGQSPSPMPDDFLPLSLRNGLKACKEKGNNQKIYIAEFGYALDLNVAPDSDYALDMVKRISRSYLIARGIPGVELFQWFRPFGAVENRVYEYGIWRQGQPLPAVAAYSAMTRIVENTINSKTISLGSGSQLIVFQKTDRADAAVWLTHGAGKLFCTNLPKNVQVSDIMGNPIIPRQEGTKCGYEIGEFPTYFGLGGADAYSILVQSLSHAKIAGTPLAMYLLTPQRNKGTLKLSNRTLEDIPVKLSVRSGKVSMKKDIVLSKGRETSVDVPLDKTPSKVLVKADCGETHDKMVISYPIEFQTCKKVKVPIKIDGDLSEWTERPFMEMKDRSQIMPPDPWVDWKGADHFGAKVYLGWDDSYFYLAAAVKDDVHVNKNSRAIYMGDCLQFALSPFPGLESSTLGYRPGECELGLALTDKGITVQQWAGPNGIWDKAEYVVKRDDSAKTTYYEARIPLSKLGLVASEGNVFGFGFVIFNDDTGAGAGYYYQLCPGITGMKNPSLLKRFVLEN